VAALYITECYPTTTLSPYHILFISQQKEVNSTNG